MGSFTSSPSLPSASLAEAPWDIQGSSGDQEYPEFPSKAVLIWDHIGFELAPT